MVPQLCMIMISIDLKLYSFCLQSSFELRSVYLNLQDHCFSLYWLKPGHNLVGYSVPDHERVGSSSATVAGAVGEDRRAACAPGAMSREPQDCEVFCLGRGDSGKLQDELAFLSKLSL